MSAFIDLEDVSIKFRIYHNPIPSFKEFLVNRISGTKHRDDFTEFFGLNQVTLKIRPGDRLGILGMNGAGKSTLLKTIAGIYAPHQGRVTVQGRITPLMELGAGFDAEQTGRENIYLNGALLGFSPSEMKAKEQAIAEFSELHEFLDMPVKYYSSGMYGRLAFSIATMTQADILLIDEVFATGDAHFVEKSSQRILQLLEQSNIVIIVTHNLDQIKKLCNRAIVIDKGIVVNDGEPQAMIDYYIRTYIHPQQNKTRS
jgi:ABC-type polysaccharide/polyol phosphate transport system ATPase subunit